MPENASFKDIAEELRIAEVFEEAFEDVTNGRLISQEQVKARLRERRIPNDPSNFKKIEDLCILAELEESSRQVEQGNFMTLEEFKKMERPWLSK